MRHHYLIITLMISLVSFAQPDLTVGNYTINPTNYQKGQLLTFTITIKNIGNQVSNKSKVAFYLNSSPSYSNATVLNVVSIPSISANSNYVFPFIYPIPGNYSNSGTNYILLKIDVGNYNNESNENNNNFYLAQTINIQNSVINDIHLPYPILFIHGLNSSSNTWNPLLGSLQAYYGWSYGGRIDACLNMDANNSICSYNDYYMFTNLSNIQNADMYTLNFDVNPNGTAFNNTVLSNQSAIYKQGYAVRDAVKLIMQKTGKNKVILVGHSMGGLASRQYLQNPSYYQLDGKHHIAKLATVGTPHGGSNASLAGLEGFVGVDNYSEAVRDLRTSYWSIMGSLPGTFLFGGLENLIQNYDYYYNYDVNCNGSANDVISGLNAKLLPNDLDFSCIIGTGGFNSGDDVVPDYSANLNNYYPNVADTFNLPDNTIFNVWHNNIHKFPSYNTMNMDEPDISKLAYEISPNTKYWFINSRQPQDKPVIDYDYFKIKIPFTAKLQLQLWDISNFSLNSSIIDSITNNVVLGFNNNGKNYIDTSVTLLPKTYYLRFNAVPNDYSVYYPICFSYSITNVTYINEFDLSELQSNVNLFPNPSQNFITLQSPIKIKDIKIFDITGKFVSEVTNVNSLDYSLDVSSLSNGFYNVQIIFENNQSINKKLIKN